MTSNRQLDLRIVLLMLLLCSIWAGAQTAVRIAGEVFPPLQQAGLRSLVSTVLLTGWCAVQGRLPFGRDRQWPWGLLLGVVFAFEFVFQYSGLMLTDVSRGVLFIYTSPFFAAAGAHLIAADERLSARQMTGLVLAFLGVCLALSSNLGAFQARQLVGDLLCLSMGALWGADMLIVRFSPLRTLPAERVLFYCLAVSAPILLGIAWLFGERPIGPLEIRPLVAFAYTAVMVSFVSYITMTWLLQRYPTAGIGSFIFLTPILAVAMAGLVLGERPPTLLMAALALIALGIWLVNRRRGG